MITRQKEVADGESDLEDLSSRGCDLEDLDFIHSEPPRTSDKTVPASSR